MYSIDQTQLIFPLSTMTEAEVLRETTRYAKLAIPEVIVDVKLLEKESAQKGHSLYRVIIYIPL